MSKLKWASILLLCTAALPFTHGQSINATAVAAPNLDLSSLGRVALAGNFDALSIYSYVGQVQGSGGNGSQSILSSLPNGAYQSLSSADASINAMCPFVMKDGTLAGIVVGGNFTSLGGIDVTAIALFDPTSDKVTPLPGIFGTVSSILCDQETNSVYVGGSFKAANSTNAIAWVGTQGWANLPFAGFNAPVTSITKAPNGHIVFGGSFSGLGNATVSTRVVKQVINLVTANITSGGTTATAGFSDPQNIVCPSSGTSGSGSTWLLADNTPGYWRASMDVGYEPSMLRIWNTDQDGRGAKTFRFTAHPINGILNMTYTDPSTGELRACDATCPLPQNTSYQDFHFVNSVGMNGFQIDISAWYGNGGGLNGVELFQDDIYTYAINTFNEPSCSGAEFPSIVTTNGPWTIVPSGVSDDGPYLTASIGTDALGSTSVVYQPDIKQSGNYSLTIYTPGCIQDGSCATRGIVNITATLSSSAAEAFSTQIYQTNNFDKYDQVFLGQVDAASSSFRPAVTIIPAGGPSNRHVVASRILFGEISSTGGLNGLYDFNPNQAVTDMEFSKSPINNAGTELHPNAIVKTLATVNQTIYAAGAFSDDVFENIMAFSESNATSLPGGGLNAPVSAIFPLDDFLYVGGNFTDTSSGHVAGLENVASYQFSTNAWVPLGAGLNGPVHTIVPLQMNITQGKPETVIGISGSFSQVLATGTSAGSNPNGFAIWVPSHTNWLSNLNVSHQWVTGSLSAYAAIPGGPWLLAGTIASAGNAISGAASLVQSSGTEILLPYPVSIHTSPTQSSLSKRSLSSGSAVSGVAAASFYDNGGRNVTIFAGHFSASASNGSTIQNLLFLNGSNNDAVTGLPPGVDTNSTFLALALEGDLLFAGGSVSGEVGGSAIDGLIAYDLHASAFISPQPAALQGDNVIVNAIATRPGTPEVYIGGSFDSAGSLPCSTVCMFQATTGQWNAVGSGLSGVASALYWTSNGNMLAAGNLSVNGNSTSLATYNAKQQNWTATASPEIPGPITAFAPAASDASQIWVSGTATNGSTFLIEIDGSAYRPVGNVFGSGTTIRSLQVMTLTKSHGSTTFLDDNQDLLLCGQINLPQYGNVSAALFDGTNFTPFILSSTADGGGGSLAGLFSSKTNPLKSGGHHHSKGITILVSLCAALGALFLIVLIGIIFDRIQRRRAGYNTVPNSAFTDKQTNLTRVPPEHLFGTLGQRGGNGVPPTV